MQCPKCHSQPLRASKIEQGLSAMGCNQCHGALVTLLYYRDWLERTPQSDHESDNPPDEQILHEHPHADHDSHSALSCPKCGRLMAKFRISGESDNRIDLCAFCDEAWLDGGEWELLKTLELNRKMPIVFTQQWQNKVRKELTQKSKRVSST